jgi:hypothetical protein
MPMKMGERAFLFVAIVFGVVLPLVFIVGVALFVMR